jgi:hypothetical protein
MKSFVTHDFNVMDLNTGAYVCLFSFDTLGGEAGQLILPAENVGDHRALKRALVARGAVLPKEPKEVEKLLRALAHNQGAAPFKKAAARTGWIGKNAFVTSDQIIGHNEEDLLSPVTFKKGKLVQRSQGSLDGWKSVVAEAENSSAMIFALGAAFGSPLLHRCKLPSFGAIISGKSQGGKSTALLLAGSTIGFGEERDLPNFNTSEAAFSEMPAAFNDLVLPLNELGTLAGSKSQKNQRLERLSYILSEGHGTTYHSNAVAKGMIDQDWRLTALVSSEHTADAIAGSAGGLRALGAASRLFDLPGQASGHSDVFDWLEMDEGRQALIARICGQMRDGISENHGVVMEAFIRKVIKKPVTTGKVMRDEADRFLAKHRREDDPNHLNRIVTACAHVCASTILAVRHGVLDFSESRIRAAIGRCYARAKDALRTEADIARAGLNILRDIAFAKDNVVLNSKTGYVDWSEVDFYVDKITKRRKFVVKASAFANFFSDARQPSLTLGLLAERGLLANKPSVPSVHGRGLEWAVSQPNWGTTKQRPRSITIYMDA